MANTLLTISKVTKETLRVLVNNLVFARHTNREYDPQFAKSGAKIGNTINVRMPIRYITNKGQALIIQDSTERSVPLTLSEQAQVGMSFSSVNLALDIDEYSDRFIAPAAASIANTIDADGLALYDQIPNCVGTPGTTPTDLLTYGLAKVALDDEAAPSDGQRVMVLSSLMETTIVNALKGLFHAAKSISDQYRKGAMGEGVLGFDWYMDQNVKTHVVGALGGTPLVKGANQTGSSLLTDGWSASVTGVLKKGDVITLASVNGVNPQSRESTGQLRNFVVTQDVDSNASGNATVPIYPAITTSGAEQTVTAAPADNAVIKVFGHASTYAGVSTRQGLAYHRDAFTLGTADLFLPKGADDAYRVASKQIGVSLRVVRDYEIRTDEEPCRVDVLYGWAALRRELACRIAA